MSQMATVPIFACRGCGKPVYGLHLSMENDPDNEKLKDAMQNMAKIAICKHCKARYNYLAQQGRSDEFNLNPNLIIYNVVDPTEVDYYGRKTKM